MDDRAPSPRNSNFWSQFALLCVLIWLASAFIYLPPQTFGQTSATGAVTGVTFDPTGAVLGGVTLHLKDKSGPVSKSVTSDAGGKFSIPLLPPGQYELEGSKTDFEPAVQEINIHVTETLRLVFYLQIATRREHTTVSSQAVLLQLDSSALGRVVDESTVSHLPLATRNFAQLTSLSPGVTTGVYNAGELGLGGTAQSQIAQSNDGIFVNGARSYDNNFVLDGISVSDVQGSASGSGGIPTPSPDSIQEFKVQTGLYDAAYGRYGGGSVSVVTKSGTNDFHGTVFEFLRNEIFNANDFFLNRTGVSRPVLKQNQFGFALGGPVRKDSLLFFGSYQGTRQVNGIAAGQSRTACSADLSEPPLTNDRSRSALGKLFGGMVGAHGGTAIAPDGSNINPAALALLNTKLSDGSFMIPTPQTLNSDLPLVQQGFSVLVQPCHFDEDQFSANIDYFIRSNSKLSLRFFSADDRQRVTFPGNGVNPSGNIPGFSSPSDSDFRVLSLSHTHSFSSAWLNQLRFGFVRIRTSTQAKGAFRWSDVGVAEGEMSHNNELPSLSILGSVSIASGFPRTINQDSFGLADDISFVHGPHTLQLGGSLTRLHNNVDLIGLGSFVEFLSWPDFLLGLSANQNGSSFSNVFASFDDFGLTTREYRAWEGSLFVQDDYRIRKSLTLNVGLRYERLGEYGDQFGRNASFDVNKANPNPPATGSMAGYVVASNFPGTAPPGVVRADNAFGNNAEGQNTISPRLGFAWQFLPNSSRVVLRGGYGMYHSRPTGQAFYQNLLGAPFSEFRLNAGQANANATFNTPFAQPFPTPASFPLFPAYSPTTSTTVYSIAPGFRPAMFQQFSLNLQAALHANWLLEVGYVGSRGEHLLRQRSLNQALSASPDHPIRGVTDNTLANISQRVPILGVPPDSLVVMESEGSSWYHGLQASLTKRLSHGLQFLASYTFSKTLDTDGADINSTSSGNALTLGDQNSDRQRWGRASFDRTHRFIFSETWMLPSPSSGVPRQVFGGWNLDAVATVQSGTALTIAYTNGNNIFGISEDRAQLSGACSQSQLVKGGSIGSKLNSYFNASCFTTPAIIGADGEGTAFGNSSTGIVTGPGQANLDLAASKTMSLPWPTEISALEFRMEYFNALNHPQFANPDANFASPTFGLIRSTTVNPRVGQVSLRMSF